MRELPEHGWCFVCGKENPHSIGVKWFVDDNGTIITDMRFTLAQQGPPGYAHGGASAAVMDEAMGMAVWVAGIAAASVNLNVNYHHPIPLNEEVHVEGRITGREGRAVHTEGKIMLADGTVAVTASGIYVEAEHIFSEVLEKWKRGGS